MIYITWFFLSFVVASIGANRQIGGGWSFVASLFLSPLVGFIIVFTSEKKKTKADCENELLKSITMMEKGIITPEEYEKRKVVIENYLQKQTK